MVCIVYGVHVCGVSVLQVIGVYQSHYRRQFATIDWPKSGDITVEELPINITGTPKKKWGLLYLFII